jgi:hypothetical protein
MKSLDGRDLLQQDQVFNLDYVPTDRMAADILTKPLEHVLHEKMCHLLGLHRHPLL